MDTPLRTYSSSEFPIREICVDDWDSYRNLLRTVSVRQAFQLCDSTNIETHIAESFTALVSKEAVDFGVTRVIADPYKDSLIGICGTVPTHVSKVHECYYAVLPEHRGFGAARCGMRSLLNWATSEQRKLIALIDISNESSRRVAERSGMLQVGKSRLRGRSQLIYISKNSRI